MGCHESIVMDIPGNKQYRSRFATEKYMSATHNGAIGLRIDINISD